MWTTTRIVALVLATQVGTGRACSSRESPAPPPTGTPFPTPTPAPGVNHDGTTPRANPFSSPVYSFARRNGVGELSSTVPTTVNLSESAGTPVVPQFGR